jgi:hypothetical protein
LKTAENSLTLHRRLLSGAVATLREREKRDEKETLRVERKGEERREREE